MAFTGQRYVLALNGGFNANENEEQIPTGEASPGSRNINTHNGGAEKRGGTELVGSLIAGNPTCLGGGQLVKRSSTIHNYFVGNDGAIYRDGSSIKTGRSTTAYNHLTVGDDVMIICNGVNAVQVDTGSSIADITTPAADWTGSAQPKRIVIHGKGASRRAFAFGIAGKEDTLYYSVVGDFEDWTGSGSGTIVVDTGDGQGITNVESKDGQLFIFGRNRPFILLDDSTDVSTWGYIPAAWNGGVHSPRHMVVGDNDIYAVSTDFEIYSIANAEQLRNYKRSSIARPSFIHNFITNNVNKATIDEAHLSFDPKIRALKLFVRRSGESEIDTALVYYIDDRKWAPPHDSQDNQADSGYSAKASWKAFDSSGDLILRTGDYNGGTWDLETVTKTDNGNAYKSVWLSSWINLDLPGIEKRFNYGGLHYNSKGDFQIEVKWFLDNTEQTTETVNLGSNGDGLGSFILDTSTLGVTGIDKQEFSLGNLGEKIRFELSNDGLGEDFFFSHIIIYFINRGVQRVSVTC